MNKTDGLVSSERNKHILQVEVWATTDEQMAAMEAFIQATPEDKAKMLAIAKSIQDIMATLDTSFLTLADRQDEKITGVCICCKRPGKWRKLPIYVRPERSLLSFCDECCKRDGIFEGATPMQIWAQETGEQPLAILFMSFLMSPTSQYTFDEYNERLGHLADKLNKVKESVRVEA